MDFSFASASQIIFGNNSSGKLPKIVKELGAKVLLVTGKNSERAWACLKENEFDISIFKIEQEPTTQIIQNGILQARKESCDVVIGFGGGSVIDGAKAIAALVPNEGDMMNYLEVIGQGLPLTKPPLPCIAVPTTAGTGAEVTKNSVIKSTEQQVKVSLRSDLMYPNYAVIDPVLTHSMPPALTASTGVDALTHLLETFVSHQANPFVDMMCREGLKRISKSLLKAYKEGSNAGAREDMAMASMLGGMALANAKLGAIHGFAGPVGGMLPIAHGAICAGLMPAVFEMNIELVKEQKLDTTKFDELARILTGNDMAIADDAVVWASTLVADLEIPTLGKLGLNEDLFPSLLEKGKSASSMKGNPVKLNDEQLQWILEKSL